MKYISTTIFAILTVILVSSCKNEQQKESSFLKVEKKIIDEKFGDCNGEGACGKVKIEYVVLSGNNETVDAKINSAITKSISSFNGTKSIEEASKKFISEFASFAEEFPDATNNKWDISMLYKVENNTEKTLSLSFYMEGYTGGAHGFRTLTYTNYNPKTGDNLKLDDVVSSIDKLTAIAKEIFIKNYKLDPNKSLNEQGFWFLNDVFALNNNFLITDKGIDFHYNQYEIAPYSLGAIDINIPMDKLEGILK